MRSARVSTGQLHDKRSGIGAALALWLLRQTVALLAQRERWFLLLPVPLAGGIACYFALAVEPPGWVLGVAVVGALGALVAARSRSLAGRATALTIAFLCAGFALAQWQTIRLDQPRPISPLTATIEGRVVLVEPRAAGARLTLDLTTRRDDLPERARVTARSLPDDLHVGDSVRLRARLLPPSEPVLPGGFDFGRWAYFHGIGAVGWAYGAVDRVGLADEAGLSVAEVRRRIARHAVSVLPGETGGVAAALLTGLRGDITERVWTVMQRSGLAHLLAISGLHIGLVAGTAFLFIRYAICLWPWLALRVAAHRVAAVAALLTALAYLLLAGAPVPTQRAFMMTGLVLVGLLLDRDAISLRLVALAACVVLAIDPAALFGASFQMSFAAVTALVAFYERWRWRRPDREAWWSQHIALYVLGVLVTTLVATIATAPFAVYHFGRLPTYGILANLVAVPLMAFWIMPLGLVALLLMPLGLDAPVLKLMGLGIDGVLWSATTATSWPGSNLSLPQPPVLAVLLLVLAGLWAAIWRGRLMRLAFVPVAAAVVVYLLARPPDVIVDRAGGMAVLRAGPDTYVLLAPEQDGFVLRGWRRALGIEETLAPGAPGRVACDGDGCRIADQGKSVRVATTGAGSRCDAEIVIDLAAAAACDDARTVSRAELDALGAVAVRLRNAEPLRFVYPDVTHRRPWQRQP